MDPALLAGLVLIIGVFVLLAIGAPVAIAIGLPSVLALLAVIDPSPAVFVSAQRMFMGANSFALLAIPFFVLAGQLMNSGGVARRLIDAADVIVGRLPGSLAQTNIVANALFGSVSGAGVASAAAVGGILEPRQRREGYDPAFAAAVNVASAPSGMLIPPSNTLIVYSLVSSTSVAALFAAGYGPGLVWVAACLVMALILAWRKPSLVGREKGVQPPRRSVGEATMTLVRAIPAVLMMVIVIGGLVAGYFTATESAVIAVVYSLVLGFIYRELKVAALPSILLAATRTTAVVVLLIAVSSVLSWVLAYATIPQMISTALLGVSTSPTVVLLLMMLALLIVGMFMDPTPAILIFTPIFLPVALELGVDPIHFGLMVTFNLCLGTISPPVGVILFVGSKVGRVRVEAVITRLLAFYVPLLVGLLLVVFVPGISMGIPHLLGLGGE